MKDFKIDSNLQTPEYITAKRKLDRYALERAIDEYKKDNTIDFKKRKEEIIQEELSKFKKQKEEKDLLAGANKLVDKYSDIDARYKELISEEAIEKLKIREEADEIFKKMKQQQKFERFKRTKEQIDPKKYDEKVLQIAEAQAKRMEELRKRSESIRRTTHSTDKKHYDDRQRKLANLVDQLALMNEVQKSSIQQSEPIQKPTVRLSNIDQQPIEKSTVPTPNTVTYQPTQGKVIIRNVTSEEISHKDETIGDVKQKQQQALVPRKQKSSFMQHFGAFTHKISQAAITAYEMLTFKHNRDVAVKKHIDKAVSSTHASNAYEKNMDYYSANHRASLNISSKNETKPISFKDHLQHKADEKAAMEAMKSKKNEKQHSTGQRGA